MPARCGPLLAVSKIPMFPQAVQFEIHKHAGTVMVRLKISAPQLEMFQHEAIQRRSFWTLRRSRNSRPRRPRDSLCISFRYSLRIHRWIWPMETILAQALADLKSDTETKKDTTQWVVSKFGATKKNPWFGTSCSPGKIVIYLGMTVWPIFLTQTHINIMCHSPLLLWMPSNPSRISRRIASFFSPPARWVPDLRGHCRTSTVSVGAQWAE